MLIAIHVCAADITHHVAAMARHLIAAVLLLELQAALGAGAHEDACDLGLGELPKSVGRRCIATNGAARTASALARRLGSPLPISAPGNGVPRPHLARAKVGAPLPTSAPGPGSPPAQHLHRNLGVVPLPRRQCSPSYSASEWHGPRCASSAHATQNRTSHSRFAHLRNSKDPRR